jgi:hypothetical protein
MTLPLQVRCCAHIVAEPDSPFFEEEEEDDRLEFDPTSLESWILDNFDWDIEHSYPERGDFPGEPTHERELTD